MTATSPYLNTPTRSESEVTLGRLMAAIDDAEWAHGWWAFVKAVDKVFDAKARYDEARLREGDQHQ